MGETPYTSSQNAAAVAQKIRNIMGTSFNRLNYIVATHMHSDHIGYVGYGGIWGLVNNHNFAVDTLIDRDSGVWTDANGNNAFDNGETAWRNAGDISGTANNWLPYAQTLNRVTAVVGSTTQIDLGQGVTVTVIQSDGQGVMMEDGQTPISGNHTTENTPPSENDYSITLMVSFGNLDYVTGSDTDGDYDDGYGYTYNDVESVIAPRIGQVEILHVNHHGSEHSSNPTYVNTLNPDISIISCGSTNTYGHPEQDVLNRLLATSTVYLTERGDPGRNYGNAVIVNGDIMISTTDGTTYTVNGNTYRASDPPHGRSLKEQILDQIDVLEEELDELRGLAQQLPD